MTAQRMRHLVEALLLLARQETTQGLNGHTSTCDLAAILEDSRIHLAPLAAERGIALAADLHPAPCVGDPGALSVLATNLVNNALQHHQGLRGLSSLPVAPGPTANPSLSSATTGPASRMNMFPTSSSASTVRTRPVPVPPVTPDWGWQLPKPLWTTTAVKSASRAPLDKAPPLRLP